MPFFDGRRGRMHYRRWPIESPLYTVVLLPGTGQHSSHYHRFARALKPAGAEVWALDTSGHGLSEGDPHRPGTLAELVADAVRLVELAGTGLPLILMGHSLGAVTALGILGAAVPDSSVATTDSMVLERDYPLRPALPVHTLAGLVLSGVPPRALGGGAPGAPGTPLPRQLPVLAVHGVDDRRAPIDAIRVWTSRHESVDLRQYTDAGHDLLHEPVHARVTADIADWMQGVVVGLARHP
ncbi:alpha/beta hydrolase [Streptomyces gardneri]|uniref:alpha/beta hydrolase n=1 Tax=Nocardia TaxID=1817 RepID=UPI00135CD41F|nr:MULTISPECIES: alpha/beta hydrolase [Nocardia]MBF6163671.1 alpha/beta hydrolase [Streptomyces gardneri]MBF6208366.1 alpha/beta hydrolase [Streptomyces gardneri]